MHAIDPTKNIRDTPATTPREAVGDLESAGVHFGVDFWATDGLRDWASAISDWRAIWHFQGIEPIKIEEDAHASAIFAGEAWLVCQ